MRIEFFPSNAEGEIAAPPSKSMAHRYLVLAGLSDGESVVHNVSFSQDILATLSCLRALGVRWKRNGNSVTVYGLPARSLKPEDFLSCDECGSTLRFMVPVCLLTGERCVLTGSERLLSRPLSVYRDLCTEQGFIYEQTKTTLTVKGQLAPGDFIFPGNISSQFVTGLLMTLPLLSADSRILLTGGVESRSYIEMTLAAMARFGVNADWSAEDRLYIPGRQRYDPKDVTVEGDWSNAAFLYALSFLHGGSVQVTGTSPDSLQGDRRCIGYIKSLSEHYSDIDLSDCPDLGPVLFAFAAANHGGHFTGTKRLSDKESDRVGAMAQELAKFGVCVKAGENEADVSGSLRPPDTLLYGHNDHRIVMALSCLLSVTGGILEGVQAVRKSYPDFFQDLEKLKVNMHYEAG
ncbi:MAG: 3-phosphoshikimate 1-carboxyvinyltransferase [Clostridia bacterium]|nr:3-phosphoshikimate 1-carboxyvinyltransferase [Clostridia bacterium]